MFFALSLQRFEYQGRKNHLKYSQRIISNLHIKIKKLSELLLISYFFCNFACKLRAAQKIMAKKNDIEKVETASIQPVEQIESLIITIRGKQVILDRDLARLYGVETRVLNQAVQRNIERFPEDFMFKLTKEEFDGLRSQIVTSNEEVLRSQNVTLEKEGIDLTSQIVISNKRGGQRYVSYAFTENGIAMLSSVLRSPIAIATNIHIMRAFNAMRHFIGSHAQVFQRLEVMERNQLALNAHQEELSAQVAENNKKIEEVFRRLDQGEAVPKEMVFFKGEFFVARVIFEKIVKSATKRVIIIDEYIDAATFEMLDVRAKGVMADIYSNGLHATLRDAHNKTVGVEPIQTHKWRNASHDRWIIADDTLYHCGHSLKDTGNKLSCIDMITSISADVVLNYVR